MGIKKKLFPGKRETDVNCGYEHPQVKSLSRNLTNNK